MFSTAPATRVAVIVNVPPGIISVWVVVTVIALVNAYPLSFILVRGGRAAWVGAMMIGLLIPFWVNEILRAFAWQLLLARFGPINNLLIGVGVLDEPYPFLNHDVGVIVGLT